MNSDDDDERLCEIISDQLAETAAIPLMHADVTMLLQWLSVRMMSETSDEHATRVQIEQLAGHWARIQHQAGLGRIH